MALATIINYCTNDFRFIGKCIEEVRHFSDQILIPVCDHFFDEHPENRFLLEHTYAAHPDCQFIEFAYSPSRLYSPYLSFSPADAEWTHIWHSTARYIGFLHLKPEVDTILFLDCDEIPEGTRVAKWLQTGEYRKRNSLLLLVYFYALQPNLRAKKLQQVPLLAKRAALEVPFLLHPKEREGTHFSLPGPKQENVRGADSFPLFHHYSWVRPAEECYQKAKSWAHRRDADWPELIRQTFEGGEKMFGSDHEFEEIPDIYFDPLSISLPTHATPPGPFSHVKRVAHRDIFEMELERIYGDCSRH